MILGDLDADLALGETNLLFKMADIRVAKLAFLWLKTKNLAFFESLWLPNFCFAFWPFFSLTLVLVQN